MAEQTIDRVQVEIEATGKNIDNVFKNIESYLTKIESALSKIDVSKLEKVNSTLSKVNKTVSTTSTKSVTPTINTSQLDKASSNIESKLSDLRSEFAGLSSYANAALNGDSSSYTSFQRRIISINSHIDTLQSKLNDVGNIQVPSSEWIDLQSKISEATNTLSDLKTQEEEYRNTHPGYEKEAEYQNIISAIQATETEIQNLKDAEADLASSGGDSTSFSESSAFANYQNQLSSLQSQVSNTADRVSAAFNEMDSQSLDGIKSALDSVTSSAKNAATKLWELAKSGITSGINGVKTTISALASRITKLGSSITSANSGFSKGFTTILKYGFGIRSLYVLFRRLRTAVTDSFTELQTSGAFFETTNANVDALSDSLTTLKYQFGAAFEPIFNTVAPALQTLINYLVSVMNTISAFIAKLTGASTYSKAVVSTAAIADNTGSAADSAEDLNKQLQGFDELNNLSGDSDSGGGSGGSSSSDDSTVTYVEESVESSLTSFWNSLADAISAGDWFSVGSIISDKLTESLNNIDWPSIYSVASDFGENFALFLNGLITDDLFTALGTTIASAIKTALYAKLSFSETFEWSDLGTAIASGINAFVDSNVLQLSVETFNSWARGILDTLIAAIQNISWSGIASTIAECIGTFDASGIMGKLGTVANGIANALYTLVSNKDTWSNLGTKISEGINSFVSSMSVVDSKTGKSGWSALGGSLSNAFTGFGDMIVKALEDVEWEDVGQGIADFINGIDWTKIKFTLGNILTAIKNAIVELIKGLNLSAADVATATVSIAGIGLTILTISGISFAASIGKKVITDMIAAKIAGLLGTGTISLGTIGSAIGNVGLTIAVAVVGWKLGTLIYENATGKAAPSFSEIVSTLASDGAFGDLVNGIKLDLQGDASITWDLANTLSSLTGTTATMTVNDLSVSAKKVKVDVDTTTTNSAMPFTNQLATDTLLGKDFSEMGADTTKGYASGAKDEAENGTSISDAATAIKDEFIHAIKTIMGINSPSTVMMPYGGYIFEGIIEGFKSKFNSLSETIGSFKDSLISWFSEKFSGFSISDYLGGWTDTNVTVSATLGTPKNTLKGWGEAFDNNITSKWVTTRADVSADLGGDLEDNGINTFSTWETIFSNFKSIWTGTSATFKAKTGGEISNISDLGSWQTTFENLYNTWKSRDAKFTAGYGNGTSSNSIGTMKDTIKKLTDAWFGESVTFAATYASNTSANSISTMKDTIKKLTDAWFGEDVKFGATYANGTSASTIGNMKDAISKLTEQWKSPGEASFKASFNQSLSTMQGYKDAIEGIYDSWTGKDATFNVWANVDTTNFDSIADSLVSKINSKLSNVTTYKFTRAEGGVLVNGMWKSIPQYADGSLNAGSMFIAGEAGPELVGHISGRTEVLNKSQLASVMYSSVSQAMRNFGNPTSPSSFAVNSSGYTPYGGNTGSRSNSDALIMEQNRLLSEQNVLLQQIANKDSSISVTDIFSAIQAENNNYMNRTGNSAFF